MNINCYFYGMEDNKKPCNTIYSTNIMSNGSFNKKIWRAVDECFSGVITLSRKNSRKSKSNAASPDDAEFLGLSLARKCTNITTNIVLLSICKWIFLVISNATLFLRSFQQHLKQYGRFNFRGSRLVSLSFHLQLLPPSNENGKWKYIILRTFTTLQSRMNAKLS